MTMSESRMQYPAPAAVEHPELLEISGRVSDTAAENVHE